jgi:hypothetical protein
MKRLSALLGLFLVSGFASAGPADYIYTPDVQYGEREIDFKYGEATPQAGDSAQGASIGFGYGAQEHWFTEIYLKHEREEGHSASLAEWENKFQLTETGQYAVDMGFVTELEAPLSTGTPWELRAGPLLQTESGKLQLNGNLLFERPFGANDSGTPYTTSIGYQWQAKYRRQPTFEFGLQGFGEMGKWNHWDARDEQNHRIGPMVSGKLALGNRRVIKYNAAWLAGVSNAAPDHTFRLQIEYEF